MQDFINFENLGGKCEVGISSTVADISSGEIKILRQGKIFLAQILESLN